jgi:hypothetical protein
MALRKLLSRGLPEVPSKEEAADVRSLLTQALDVLPIAPVRLFWDSFSEMRPWWPVLLPLLAWVGWRTYQRERAAVLSEAD